MKHSLLYLSAAAALVWAACTRETVPQENIAPQDGTPAVAGPNSFTVSIECDPESKAVLGVNDSGKPQNFWENGDAISVYSSNDPDLSAAAGHKFVTILDENSPIATFDWDGEGAVPSGDYLATYPNRTSGRGVNFTVSPYRVAAVDVPQSQTLVPGTYDKKACPMTAFSAEGSSSLEFKNAAALLKFRVSESNIVTGRIEVDPADAISGRFRADVDVDTHIPTLSKYTASGVAQYNAISFSIDGTTALSTGTDYYVVIRPTALTSDLKIYLNGNLVKVINQSQFPEIKRNKIYNLGTLTTPATPAEKVLTFDFSGDPLEGWPTADKWKNAAGELDCTYPLYGTDYHFFLTDCGNAAQARVAWVKASGGLILYTTWRYVGLPAIEGYRLVKVSGTMCLGTKDTRKAAIVKNVVADNTAGTIAALHEFVSGGESTGWTTKGTTYTFNLSGTEGNTMYYFLCTNTSVGVSDLTLTYVPI